MRRRGLLSALLALSTVSGAAAARAAVERGRALVFPRDHGAHVDAATEWWYATGWLGSEAAPTHGFQLTFFRSRTGLAATTPGRFAARQLLFAHAAVTDLGARTHRHAQRIARWNGDSAGARADASSADTALRIGDWSFVRGAAGYAALLPADGFALQLALAPTAPPLLQGEAGWSRKGPDERQASHYVSEPQLAVRGTVTVEGRRVEAAGRGWLDHEWSDTLLDTAAVGWDWIGIDLFDGSALTAFRLRRADGSALWAGGSLRAAGSTVVRAFAPADVTFVPGRSWTSPATQARYPVEWAIETPAGRHLLRALLDAQELDGRAGSGTVYWEGLSELLDEHGRRVGLGYLELTGYAGRLRL